MDREAKLRKLEKIVAVGSGISVTAGTIAGGVMTYRKNHPVWFLMGAYLGVVVATTVAIGGYMYIDHLRQKQEQ